VTDTKTPSTSQLLLEDVGVELHGRWLLKNINSTITAGEPLALTGPSGSGKTLLCMVLAGGIEPTRGQVLLDGELLAEAPRSSIGLILQTHGLISGLTAEENVALPLQAGGVPRAEILGRSNQALAAVGLARESDRLVEDLSGGERQRVGVARALAGDPLVLVADEPTAELDAGNRQRVLEVLMESRPVPRILVVASDDPEVIAAFPRVVELENGSVKHQHPSTPLG
jgi:putative ABC transport system ATP-binding protein